MPRWTPEDLKAYELKQGYARDFAPRSKPEPAVCNGPLAEIEGEKRDAGKITVRITSFRARLLDPDNLCPKYFIDGLRYAGLIPDDRPQDINLEVAQKKVGAREEEKTVITIEPI